MRVILALYNQFNDGEMKAEELLTQFEVGDVAIVN